MYLETVTFCSHCVIVVIQSSDTYLDAMFFGTLGQNKHAEVGYLTFDPSNPDKTLTTGAIFGMW